MGLLSQTCPSDRVAMSITSTIATATSALLTKVYTNGNYYSISGYYGIMENKMETTIVYLGYYGIMENKTETTIVYSGNIGMH